MKRLLPYLGIALAVALGIALAPYVWYAVGAAGVIALGFATLAVIGLLLRLVRHTWWTVWMPRYERFQDRLDPVRAKLPRWFLGWRGALLVTSPIWITVIIGTIVVLVTTSSH